MYNLGSIIGGIAGFFLGGVLGPIGMIFGAVLGSSIGRNLFRGSSFTNSQRSGFQSVHSGASLNSGQIFFESVFSMLGKMAGSDGTVTEDEMAVIRQFMSAELRLDPMSQQAALQIFHTAVSSNTDFSTYAERFYLSFRQQRQMLELVLDFLLRVAAADQVMKSREEALILEAVRIFRIDTPTYERLKNRTRGGWSNTSSSSSTAGNRAYTILGCSQSDSESTIRKAYRQKASEFHPDKIAAKGLPGEFSDFAAEKFREIQEAWDTIRKERSF